MGSKEIVLKPCESINRKLERFGELLTMIQEPIPTDKKSYERALRKAFVLGQAYHQNI